MRIKICGITNVEDAMAVTNLGFWAIGFNFYHHSPRYISVEKARQIIQQLPDNILTVGIVVNESTNRIKDIMHITGIDKVQYHSDRNIHTTIPSFSNTHTSFSAKAENPGEIASGPSAFAEGDVVATEDDVLVAHDDVLIAHDDVEVAPHRIIKPLSLTSSSDIPSIPYLKQYSHILIDAVSSNKNLYGGTGQLANWELAKQLARQCKLILAGGINENNILQAIKIVQPYAIDICSGVEKSPGLKDSNKLHQLMQHVKEST